MRRTTIALVVLALSVLGFMAPANAGAPMRPFKGVVAGVAVVDFSPAGTVCPLGLTTTSTAQGTMTHMGLTTMSSTHCTPPYDTITGGMMTMVAANGDHLNFTYVGKCVPPPFPAKITCDTVATVTGGTGRFMHARGTVHMIANVTFGGSLDLPTVLPGTWTMNGMISY